MQAILVPVEAESLEPLGEPEEAFHEQKPDYKAIGREAIPTGYRGGVGHVGH